MLGKEKVRLGKVKLGKVRLGCIVSNDGTHRRQV